MTDVAIKFKDLRFDVNYILGDLEADEGLETAVTISLFTDRRVFLEELPAGQTERKGWWGDALEPTGTESLGSRLWLLSRSKVSEDTRNLAEEYAKEALQWLLNEGVAESVSVSATLVNKNERIDLSISIHRPRERNTNFYRYQLVWDGQMLKLRGAS